MNDKKMELVKNSLGRMVPTEVNGRKTIPFRGVGVHKPAGRRAAPFLVSSYDYPAGGKLQDSLRTALVKSGLRDGCSISTHHHFRDGDIIANQVFDIAAEMGIKDLIWYPSASFPCHDPLVKYLENGVIHHIEGSLNGPLGEYCSRGKMKGLGFLRSHGGRFRAIRDGDIHIDIAVMAAPIADEFGNSNGKFGPSACGTLGFATGDSMYADKVIVVTDNLVPVPCPAPWQIEGNYVDFVVTVDKVGIPEKIVSGTTRITRSPNQLLIAEMTARFLDVAGIVKNGFNFQAGAGGTSLAFVDYLHKNMKRKGVKSNFVVGGITELATKLMEEGDTGFLLDGQTFDIKAIESFRKNQNYIPINIMHLYDPHSKGNMMSYLDAVVIGATEVDVDFNANVASHSDGLMLHGIGGWQNCMFAKCTIIALPSFRNRTPVIRDRVTTLCAPGELLDVIITERGIAVNPRRTDLIDATRHSNLPIRDIGEIKEEVEKLCGGPPASARTSEKVVAGIEWVDGTIIDSVFQVMD